MSLEGRIDAVVIGASAGGIQALSEVLPALSQGLKTPVFIVLHLPRDKPSVLAEIFSRKCAVPVREAEDKEEVAPGTVYFAPNDYHLLVDKGPRLALSADDPVHHSRPSIDVLFESAAEVYGNRLLGVVLSGANEDGASGLAAIHNVGGLTVVQSPETALSPQMALSALKRCPAEVLRLEQIARLFQSLSNDSAASRTN